MKHRRNGVSGSRKAGDPRGVSTAEPHDSKPAEEPSQDMPLDINDDGTLQKTFGELKRKGSATPAATHASARIAVCLRRRHR